MKNKLIKAVLFDFDGTLTMPGSLDFAKIKDKIGCPQNIPVLEFIENIKDKDQQIQAHSILENFELQGAKNSKLNSGVNDLISFLKSQGVLTGIITRNKLCSIKQAMDNFESIQLSDFNVIITRDDPVRPKPDSDGILLAAKKLDINAEDILVVGDFIFDIQAGEKAGATTIYLTNNSSDQNIYESDYTVSDLTQVKDIVRLYLPLLSGKFPNDLLKKFLDEFNFHDPSVIIHPGIGEDIAAVNVENEEVLILKSDPITFATDAIGHYAVLINANDIATSGAVPRWFLTTLMFPCGTTPIEVFHVLHDLESVCKQSNITLCGGHTEITDAVTRPVVTGMLAGTVKKSDLIDKQNIKSGDKILLTKGIAVEGTSIIAREFEDKLLDMGMNEADIEECKKFLSYISILKEAEIAAKIQGTSAMHDITEGGLATALEELSIAGDHKIQVHMENIPIFPQTQTMCSLLDINPLGLIGSGSLLICCREENCKDLIAQIFKAGIMVTYIGEVLESGQGIEALAQGKPVNWPKFEVDEITQLFN